MIPAVLFLLALATDNVYVVAFAALLVPTSYVLVAGVGEFLAGYLAKGGGHDPLRFYIKRDDSAGWELETGGIDRLVTVHQSGRTITHVEPTVRFSVVNFSSLGIDLALGAIAIDIAWAIDGTVDGNILLACLALQVPLAFVSLFALMLCQKWPPDKRWLVRVSALFAIFFGFFAMFLSFTALDPRIVTILLDSLF